MKIDFSPLMPVMDELFYNLLLILLVPFILALIIKYLLLKVRIPGSISSSIASLAFLYAAYKMLVFITG
jgi:hypothetical protein